MQTLSSFYRHKKQIVLGELIRGDKDDPAIAVSIDQDTLKPIDHGKKRVGHPRNRWLPTTCKNFAKKLSIPTKKIIGPEF